MSLFCPECGYDGIHEPWCSRGSVLPGADALWGAIKHGDDDHQQWLQEAIRAWFAGHPVPEVRGGSRKEARVAELEGWLGWSIRRLELPYRAYLSRHHPELVALARLERPDPTPPQPQDG